MMMMDSDDDNSSITSSSSIRSDQMSVLGNDETELRKVVLHDDILDALYEKRGSTRENALSAIIQAFTNNLQYEFVEKKFASLLHPCLNSLKKGSSKEVCLAARVIGLLALTVGCGDKAREILDEATTPISQSLKSGSDPSKIVALLECLAIITFVGGDHPEQTEKSMQIMWQMVHPKLGSNVNAVKPSVAVITAMVSAWSFLLTTMQGWSLNANDWQNSISYLSTLLDKDDRSVRIAAGESLALIFEMGSLEKFSTENKGSADNSSDQEGNKSLTYLRGLRAKILHQVRDLAAEAGGKGSNKKDLNNQRNLFRDITDFLEDGYSPETSVKIGADSLCTSTWSELVQLNFLRHFLAGGFVKHMQENELLHEVFGFTPKKKNLQGAGHLNSSGAKRMFKSPNSIVNKARTQFLNKQRQMVEGRNVGQFVADGED
ncbi:hypothetical protein ACFE04_007299 [Oxalis oulophora]